MHLIFWHTSVSLLVMMMFIEGLKTKQLLYITGKGISCFANPQESWSSEATLNLDQDLCPIPRKDGEGSGCKPRLQSTGCLLLLMRSSTMGIETTWRTPDLQQRSKRQQQNSPHWRIYISTRKQRGSRWTVPLPFRCQE